LILSFSTYFLLDYIEERNKNAYLNQVTQTYTKAYKTIYGQYKELSHVVYTGLLKLANIDKKLEDIEDKSKEEQNEIRKELYLQTIQRFNTLKSKHIININYILPNNKIFLKMIDPISYDKKISEKRLLLNYAKQNKKYIDGYEVGRNGAGFRFVYPIIEDDEYLGLLSITFSEQAITSAIMKQYDVLSNVIIKDKYFDNELLKNSKIYKKAHHDGFLHNKSVLEELKEVTKKDITQMKPSQETSVAIYKQANNKQINSMFLDNQDVIITTIPMIHTLSKEQLAFIAIISKGHDLVALDKNYMIIKLLFIILYATILLVFFQQNIKRIIEKDNLNKMMQKDKQLLEQSKMAQMGEMIGNIAHQWRQPLSTISTVASGVKLNHDLGMLNEKEIPRNMNLIVENAQYLSETIDTFRDFIKEEKVKKEVVLQEKIDESIKIVKASLQNSYIDLIKDIDYDKPVKLMIVGQELSQVIINILNNAKDAIVQRKIENGYIKIKLVEESNTVHIIIEDNAQGIKKENMPKIFDPYFTTKHKFKGTGLGLYMSKTIIEKHFDGELSVQNGADGAMFTISLPK